MPTTRLVALPAAFLPCPAGRTESRGGAAAAPQLHAGAGPAGEAGVMGRGRGQGAGGEDASASAPHSLQHAGCWPSAPLTCCICCPYRCHGRRRPCAAGGVGGAPGGKDGGRGGRQRPTADHLQLPHPLAAAAGHAGAQELQLQARPGGGEGGGGDCGVLVRSAVARPGR